MPCTPHNKPTHTVKHPDHIMKAIDLLQHHKVKNRLPRWLIPLDYFLAACIYVGFWGGIAYLIYKLTPWL